MQFCVLILILFSLGKTVQAACVFNTDNVEDKVLKNDQLIWNYLAQNPDCKITPMTMRGYARAERKNIEVLPFEYDHDNGKYLLNTSLGLCQRNVATKAVLCDKKVREIE